MEKQELKKAISKLSTEDQMKVTFVGEKFSNKTGEYKIVSKKKGRGKGGSLLLVAKNLLDNAELVFGTPDSESVLNMTLSDGTFLGYRTEAEVPKIYPTNSGRAVQLKEQLKELLTVENVRIEIDSTEPEFTGIFTMKNVEKISGRYGQMIMNLVDTKNVQRQLWTFRHSGIINSIKVLTK
jgi:hypothetical protein